MFTLLGVLLTTLGFSYATNCYEIQQAQISSLDDRMAHMLNSFYRPLPQNAVPAVASAPGSDYNPYPHTYPYPYPYPSYPPPYPLPPNLIYGPAPVLYSPPVPVKRAVKPPTYNTDPREHNVEYNWARYYDSPHHYERSYPPATYQMLPYPYPPFIPPSQYIMPWSSPPDSYPWEHGYIPEYTTHNYAAPPPILPFTLPPPYPQLYHTPAEGSPPHTF